MSGIVYPCILIVIAIVVFFETIKTTPHKTLVFPVTICYPNITTSAIRRQNMTDKNNSTERVIKHREKASKDGFMRYEVRIQRDDLGKLKAFIKSLSRDDELADKLFKDVDPEYFNTDKYGLPDVSSGAAMPKCKKPKEDDTHV